ncbi:MAG: helix-turn-helix domain-containing protein [Pseudonocardiaceae bacterium]
MAPASPETRFVGSASLGEASLQASRPARGQRGRPGRHRRGRSPNQFAAHIGWPQPRVSKIETGAQRPSPQEATFSIATTHRFGACREVVAGHQRWAACRRV